MSDSEINPAAVFTLIFLIFITLTLIHYVFFIFSVWSFTIGILLGYLLLKSYGELPSLLLLLQVTGTIRAPKNVYNDTIAPNSKSGCTICSKKGCARHKPKSNLLKNPWENLTISKPVDDALTELFEITLNTHIYSWYRDLSHDQGLVDELRFAFLQTASVLFQRLKTVNLAEFVNKRILKKFMIHVDTFFYMKERVISKDDLQQKILDHLKTYKHFCTQNDKAEEEYLRYTVQTLLPYLLPNTSLSCKGLNCFIEEIDVLILKPLVEKIADPDFVNNLLLIFLDDETIPEPNYVLSEKVNFLERFGSKLDRYTKSSLNITTYELMHDASYLYPFMQFMKREDALNILQFCLAVEEFNKRILAAELTESEAAQIIEEAKEIDDLYFKSDAVDKINFPIDVIRDFQDGISCKEIDRVKTAAPLFRAYEHAVNIIEKVYVPLFHQCGDFFALTCGDRVMKVKKGMEENNLAKRKFMPFADLSRSISKIKAKKLQAKGEKLTSMDLLDFPMEEAYESYDEYYNDEYDDDGDFQHADNIDLSYCHITIPRIDFVLIKNKRCYVFILIVEKIGGRTDGNEQLSWQVVRKYNEFYVLDSKLRRFHEALNVIELPAKRTILKKDFEFHNSIRMKLQEYLQRLARNPVLKGSSLLQRFLTPGAEIDGMFEPESVSREAGRKVKSLKSKLVIEKGQNLEMFLNSFLNSAEPPVKKKIPPMTPKTHVFSSHRSHDTLSLPPPHWARELRRNLSLEDNSFCPCTVSEYVMYACRNYFKVPSWVHHLLIFLQFTLKNTIDVFVDKFITYKISLALAERQMVSYIHLIRDAIFFDNDQPRTDSDKVERRDNTLNKLLTYFPSRLKSVIGADNHNLALKSLFEMFQYPRLNKQLFYILMDELLSELFPEISVLGDDT